MVIYPLTEAAMAVPVVEALMVVQEVQTVQVEQEEQCVPAARVKERQRENLAKQQAHFVAVVAAQAVVAMAHQVTLVAELIRVLVLAVPEVQKAMGTVAMVEMV